MNLQPYLTLHVNLSTALRITLDYYNKGIRHDMKSDETPSRRGSGDREFIRSEIEKTYPSHAIVGRSSGEGREGIPSAGSSIQLTEPSRS